MKKEITIINHFCSTAKQIMHDPFAMRPFFGYNFGDYLQHWLSFGSRANELHLPKIFHVNWFRKDTNGKFLWPGFGENCRVLDWVLQRINDKDVSVPTPIGLVPKRESLNLDGLEDPVDYDALFKISQNFWENEVNAVYKYFDEQVNTDLPTQIMKELKDLESRVQAM